MGHLRCASRRADWSDRAASQAGTPRLRTRGQTLPADGRPREGRAVIALASLLLACSAAPQPVAPITYRPRRIAQGWPATPPAASGPDIVLVILDDVGYQDLIAVRDAGYLPNLTAMAAAGFVFTNASACPICSPTRRAMLFGDFYSRQSGYGCNPPTMEEPPATAVSIAQRMSGTGHTSAFFGKWHLGADPNGGPWQSEVQARGWDVWRAGIPYFVSGCGGNNYSYWVDVEDGSSSFSLSYQPPVMAQKFAAFWTGTSGPRFAVFSTQLAHLPYHRPPAGMLPSGYPPTPSDRDKYEAMIAAADFQVGQLLAVAPLATTVYLVVGDNGTPGALAPDPTRAKGTTFQRGVHVPLFLAGAGISPGSSQALVSVADIYATIAEIAGAPGPIGSDSVSLVPILTGAGTVAHTKIAYGIQGDTPQFKDDLAARTIQFKLRRWRADPGQPWTEEMYDLFADINEQENVLSEYPAKAASLRAFIEQEMP
ncbi:MAG: sulfatase-like hydrolase/transferase [Candidatus Nanopelagicales bacterium]